MFIKKIGNLFFHIILVFFYFLSFFFIFSCSASNIVEPVSIKINSEEKSLHGTYNMDGWRDIGLSVSVYPIAAEKNIKLNIINDTTPNKAISIKNKIVCWSPIKQEKTFSFSIYACSIFDQKIYDVLDFEIRIEKQLPKKVIVNYSKDINIYSETYKKDRDEDGVLFSNIEPEDSKQEVVWSIVEQTTNNGTIFLDNDNKISWYEINLPGVYQFVVRATSIYDESKYGEKTFYLHINDPWKSNYLPIETLNIDNKKLLGFKPDVSFDEYKEICDTLFIPANVKEINNQAFASSIPQYIKKIEFQSHSSIQSIGEKAFAENLSIHYIKLDNCDNLSYIGEWAFSCCKILDFSINSTNNFFGIATNCGTAKCLVKKNNNCSKISKDNIIVGCLACGDIQINEFGDFDLVPEFAFAYCYGITSIDFSLQKIRLTNISKCAFYKCVFLTNVFLQTEYIEIIGQFAFANCSSIISFSLINSTNLKYIKENAFSECSNLTQIDLSKSVNLEEICSNSFYNCENLHIFSLQTKKIKFIGEQCFYGCKSLDEIIFWGMNNVPTFSIFGLAFHGISESGIISSKGEYSSQDLLDWLQGKDTPSTGVKGDFPTNLWLAAN